MRITFLSFLSVIACILLIRFPQAVFPEGKGHHEMQLSAIPWESIREELETNGLKGIVHGINPETRVYVFTWRHPDDFFRQYFFPMVPDNPEAEAQIRSLKRHQSVTVRGYLMDPHPDQRHIVVESLDPGPPWEPGSPNPGRETPEGFSGHHKAPEKTVTVTGLVHALAGEGGLFVMELADAVFPVIVPEAMRPVTLWRGDVIQARLVFREWPPHPRHMTLAGEPDALTVLDAIRDLHGREMTLEGPLVLFPDSPVLNRDIWAVKQVDENGLSRYFTLFNFEDAADQARIDAMLAGWWEAAADQRQAGRNLHINPAIRIRVTGKVNQVAVNQANPTLMIESSNIYRVTMEQ